MKHSEVSTIAEVSGKWEEAFREFLDQIYWDGYGQHLLSEDPEAYRREYCHFIALYDEPAVNGMPEAETNPQGSGIRYE